MARVMVGPPLRAAFLLAILAPAAWGFTVRRDVPYGAGEEPARRLDVYAPDHLGSTRAPVVVYVHGGGWFKGDKSKIGAKPEWLTRLGFVLVSVNYRLLPVGRHPANAEDIAAAAAWVQRRIAEYGGNPDAMFLLGHSTGAHLVSLVATDERFLAARGLGLDAVAGVIALDTDCYDLEARIRALAPEDRGLYLAAFGGHPARWRDASPLNHVTAGTALPPFLLLTAGESTSTHSQTETFARALKRVAAKAQTEAFPAETHGSLNHRLGKAGHHPTAAIESFLDDLLTNRSAGGDP
jgi:acetyl esterase/lipase